MGGATVLLPCHTFVKVLKFTRRIDPERKPPYLAN